MKKLCCAMLALAMIVAAAPVAMAATGYNEGDIYLKDDDYYDDGPQSTLAPGSSGYVYLCDYESGQSTGPKSIRIEDMEVLDSDNGKTVKLISVDRSASRLKVDGDQRAWFVKLDVRSVSPSSYPDDGFDVDILTLEYTYDDEKYEGVAVNLDAIEYEVADDEFLEDAQMFTFEKEDDVDIDLPDSAGRYTGVARKDFDVVAAMDTDVDSALLNKYPSADIRFFNGNGATFPVTSGKLIIFADSNDYLYEVSGSTLTDRSSTWDKSEDAFVVSTTKIGRYVVSDTKLSAKPSSSSSTGSSSSNTGNTGNTGSSSSTSSEYIGPPTTPSNPQTGANA
ncbi:MAG: hypothetical protein ACK5L0_04405 [Candidatus Fimivivens sp.]